MLLEFRFEFRYGFRYGFGILGRDQSLRQIRGAFLIRSLRQRLKWDRNRGVEGIVAHASSPPMGLFADMT